MRTVSPSCSSSADPRLSVIDTGWPGHLSALAPALDELGYHRLWVTEHHSASQSAAPAVLAGLAAGLTKRIRIGTAGVLINFRSPASIAADFAVLELFYPGRIDLGVTSSLAGGGVIARRLLDGRPDPTRASFERRVSELADLLAHGYSDEDGMPALGPEATTAPDLWICGTSMASAELAGEIGCCYSFHDHLKSRQTDGPSVLDHYRDAFRHAGHNSEPCSNVAAYGRCTAGPIDPQEGQMMSYRGSPADCAAQLRELAEAYGADELVIQELSFSLEDQLRSYRSLAERLWL